MLDIKHYVNGQWIKEESMHCIPVSNPANGEVITNVPMASKELVHEAIQHAKHAQKEWAKVPAPKRADYLYAIGERLRDEKERLARILTMEMGKVIEEARGEVQEAIDMAFYMAGEGKRLFGQTTPSELPNKFAMSVRAPIGVVGLIPPWNFPIAIATWKSFPAIVAGNTVVWKPSTETPLMAYELAKIIEEVELLDGVINIVFGGGSDIGSLLVEHPDVHVISFTGSTETGRKIAELGGKHLKKVSLEMCGKNAIIVEVENLYFPGFISLEAFHTSGGLSTLARTFSKLHTLEYKMIRYAGHAERFKLLVDLGLTQKGNEVEVDNGITVDMREVMKQYLENKLSLGDQEDVVLLRVEVHGEANEERVSFEYDMVTYRDKNSGETAMARTTANTISVVAKLIGDGTITERGVIPPELAVPGEKYMTEMNHHGVTITETMLMSTNIIKG